MKKEDYTDSQEYYHTMEYKEKQLGLDNEKINKLKEMHTEEYEGTLDLSDDNCFEKSIYRHIEVDKIVGYGNHNPLNWYEALDNEVCHKPISFKKYDKLSFSDYINSDKINDPPSVIEKNGKYFIYGDGTHRLTIAKVTGCKTAFVIVHKCKNEHKLENVITKE
ncbi:MAG: hypothetical protein J5802_03160 [Butyrivibrio sp.]|nr:hypothetical protein [Butyrivibrio sp.]